MTPSVCVVDFETFPIEDRPGYPPEPVGVAIKWPGEISGYYAWGHTSGNNCTREDAVSYLADVWESGHPILFHNAKFDLAVCYEKLKLPRLPWDRVHDTMFLAFLCDPHARSLGLKELAADHLDMPADEQDELHGWILTHKRELQAAWPQYGSVTKSQAGKWIFAAPGELVGRYAVGDVERTLALFKRMWPLVQAHGMGDAYDRERKLLPILMENEERGMRVDLARLDRDAAAYQSALTHVEDALRHKLSASGLNFDADRDVANVLLQRGIVPEANWQLTKSGQLSVKKDVLTPDLFTGPDGAEIASALGYRNRLKTCLTMFMQPWLAQAQKRSGYISTNWNQVRNPNGGTRTGRPSTSNPNFLNISKTWDDKKDGYTHPAFLGVPVLPLVRNYILPDEGDVWVDIDFSGQELRVFADFSSGDLWQRYQENPAIDPHQYIADKIAELTGDSSWSEKARRTLVKNVNFGKLYGAGMARVTQLLKGDVAAAKELSSLHTKAMPDISIVNDEIKRIVRLGGGIRTWGGRIYYPEAPRVVDGRKRDFVYKLINYATQGGAADFTKQVMLDWYYNHNPRSRFLVQVYDEICISAPAEFAEQELLLLKSVMEAQRLSVPMLTDPAWGRSWGEVTPYKAMEKVA